MEEYDDINKIMKIDRVYRINDAIEKGTIKDIILLAEALHEKKIAKIADNIAKNKNIKMIRNYKINHNLIIKINNKISELKIKGIKF